MTLIGTYYIENHFTHTSLADPGLDAQQYTDTKRQNFTVDITDTPGVYTIQNEADSTYVAAKSEVIGAKVISQKDAYYWTIVWVGDNHYSITTKAADLRDGDLAVQVISEDDNVPVSVGAQVGAPTQRWHFVAQD